MKRFGAGLAVAAIFVAGTIEARELEDILKDKGVISGEEAEEAKTTKTTKGTPLNVAWDKGVKFVSSDGNIKISLGGRAQADWAYFDTSSKIESFFGTTDEETGVFTPQEFGAGTELRRLRLEMGGEVYENAFFKVQLDFAGGEAEAKDVYVGLGGLPGGGELTIGHFKEPFSLEEQTSSKYITFMERALPNVFAPGRNMGFGFHNAVMGDRMTVAGGFFRDTDDFGTGFGENDDYDFTTRLTGLPVWAEEGRRMVHLGFSYSHQTRDGSVRFRQRPEAHLSPVRFVDTGSLSASNVNLISAEAATVLGPLSIQGEYMPAFVNASSAGDPDFMGYYVFVSYFLTGENRAYRATEGAFDRVKPSRSFFDGKGGPGAVELAARYSGLDLSDAAVDGGELNDFTFGVNWYWNPNLRVMLNYVFADLDSVDEVNVVQARFAADF